MGYKSDAQRKAVHASKNEAAGKMKHGSHAKMYGKSPAKAKGHTLKKTSKPAPDTEGMKTVDPRKNTLKKTSSVQKAKSGMKTVKPKTEKTLKQVEKAATPKKGIKKGKAKGGSALNMSKELTYGGPVIDQMGNALSHMGAMKVLKHSKSRM